MAISEVFMGGTRESLCRKEWIIGMLSGSCNCTSYGLKEWSHTPDTAG